MIEPCVFCQYSSTIAHSTHNMNFNKLSDWWIYQKISNKLQFMPTEMGYKLQVHSHTQTTDRFTWRTISRIALREPNPLCIAPHCPTPCTLWIHTHFNIISKSSRCTGVWIHQQCCQNSHKQGRINNRYHLKLIRETTHRKFLPYFK